MTEGIIQEVLRECECNVCKAGLNTFHNIERRRFKRELIERIKEECLNTGLNSSWISIKVLIGDGKNE